jgi:hypothetical protein
MKLDGCEQKERGRSVSQGEVKPANDPSEVDADYAT